MKWNHGLPLLTLTILCVSGCSHNDGGIRLVPEYPKAQQILGKNFASRGVDAKQAERTRANNGLESAPQKDSIHDKSEDHAICVGTTCSCVSE